MRKRLSTIMAIVVALSMLFIAGPVMAADDIPDPHAAVLGGDVPFCANWTISTSGSAAEHFAATAAAAYDVSGGEITLADFIACTDFDANSKVKISAKKSDWTVPDDYNQSDGAKKAGGADSDLLILVTVDNDGLPSGDDDLDVIGTFTGYTALTTSDQQILEAGAIGTDVGHGIEGAQFSIDSKVLMDWKYDIVGVYGVTVTLTIEEMAT